MSGGSLVESLGFRASSPAIESAFASQFLHWNVFHLLGNMLFVVVAGAAVEIALGWWRYLVVYLMGGLFGTLFHWAFFNSASNSGILVGASACVASCIGFSAIRYARKSVPLSNRVQVPVLAVIVVWAALQIVGMFFRLGDNAGATGFAAHLGGLVFGLAMSLVFRATESAELDASHERLMSAEASAPDAALVAAQAILDQAPEDPLAIAKAADAAQVIGDRTREIQYRLKQTPLPVERLAVLGALNSIPALDRMKLASSSDAAAKIALLKSVAAEASPERPNAILELILIEPDGGWKEILAKEFALHPTMDIARSRGLV
ncbi:MAG: rhomboid family intramembrane serine protease [Chthonomonas sp.]|nr:rhomboid family intramembrane serine protease [Chthonomonas sp.]